jgi:hypothetical protein
MGVPLTDLHAKFICDFIIDVVRKNVDEKVEEIFCDANLAPHETLYGNVTIDRVKKWVTETEIPVVLGWNLDPSKIPGVTVHIERSAPAQKYMGDRGFKIFEPIDDINRGILVERFIPASIDCQAEKARIVLPDDFSDVDLQLVTPPFLWRDKKNQLFDIDFDDDTTPLAVQKTDGVALKLGDFDSLEIVSHVDESKFAGGAMLFDESLLLTVHGHADRTEGLWLWAIIQWGLLKYRPLLEETFGLHLPEPSASDFAKDDAFLGDNIWRRFITLGAKTVWSWKGPKQSDAVALVLFLKGIQAGGDGTPVDLC